MKIFKNMCCGCEVCVGCYRSHVEVHVCDKCQDDGNRLYEFNGNEFCLTCLINEVYDVFLKNASPEDLITYIETLCEDVSISYNEEEGFLYNGIEYTRKEILEGIYEDLFYIDVEEIIECFTIN